MDPLPISGTKKDCSVGTRTSKSQNRSPAWPVICKVVCPKEWSIMSGPISGISWFGRFPSWFGWIWSGVQKSGRSGRISWKSGDFLKKCGISWKSGDFLKKWRFQQISWKSAFFGRFPVWFGCLVCLAVWSVCLSGCLSGLVCLLSGCLSGWSFCCLDVCLLSGCLSGWLYVWYVCCMVYMLLVCCCMVYMLHVCCCLVYMLVCCCICSITHFLTCSALPK